MGQSVNKVILIGLLGDAPETRLSQQGKPLSTFSLVVNESWKNTQGTKQERVEWFRIVCFGRLAEVCRQYLDRGRHVYIEGRLQTRKWEDRGGEKRTTVEVVASQMRILDRAPKNGNPSTAAESPRAAQSADDSDNSFTETGGESTEADVLF